ncbi:UTP--glucose-1-phosphate uridylyltransferase GalU [Ferrimonas senticii]|uniref:UTP--glucose-1-phosphate uridylyltransferase GalU n=1 Tax=Ferrimonas senticii TaxID=394566 RepID=UPI0003FAB776|nr:UTP--glucose-1-phosphate uridylyltransferase GalU [Ferrimonas senticii]
MPTTSTTAITKAVIPVAGLGTRMLPATKAIPKEMLPVVDKPLIQHVVAETIAAGIKEIVLVTHSSKNAIENHFDTSFELETTLEQRVKRQQLQEIKSVCPDDVTIISVRQPEAKGLGDAVLCARPVVGDNPFVVVLPDVLIDKYQCNPSQDNLAKMVKNFAENGCGQVMVEPVPKAQISNYGIVDVDGVKLASGEHTLMHGLIEKPTIKQAPSDLAIVGRYVLPAAIWPLLASTEEGAGNEIQLTDAIAKLLQLQPLHAFAIQGRSHDCGDKVGYMRACLDYALHHPEFGPALAEYIQQKNIDQFCPAPAIELASI